MIKKGFLIILMLPLTSFAQCTNNPVEFHDAYATTSTNEDETLNVFVTIKNRDIAPQTLTAVSSSVNAPRKIVLQSYARNSDDDAITTGIVDQITIQPGKTYSLRPEDTHIVISGYKLRPNPDDLIDLTFTMANGCSQTITNVPVQDPQGD